MIVTGIVKGSLTKFAGYLSFAVFFFKKKILSGIKSFFSVLTLMMNRVFL